MSRRRTRRARSKARILLLLLASLLLPALSVTAALALQLRAGDIVIDADGGFAPQVLPEHVDAPITLHGGGSIGTASGALPPVLQELTILFDRHGSVQTTGLERCTEGELAATDTSAARRACPNAIVGRGFGSAVIQFAEQPPLRVSSPITLFNGPPEGGRPTVLAHAYLSVPAPTTYVVPVVIERIHRGIYGYRTKARIPPIAGGHGIPISGHLTIGRRWTYHGRRYSYVNARCETGRLQAEGEFTFSDGTVLQGTFLQSCRVRG